MRAVTDSSNARPSSSMIADFKKNTHIHKKCTNFKKARMKTNVFNCLNMVMQKRTETLSRECAYKGHARWTFTPFVSTLKNPAYSLHKPRVGLSILSPSSLFIFH
jgi:hypothetical protein